MRISYSNCGSQKKIKANSYLLLFKMKSSTIIRFLSLLFKSFLFAFLSVLLILSIINPFLYGSFYGVFHDKRLYLPILLLLPFTILDIFVFYLTKVTGWVYKVNILFAIVSLPLFFVVDGFNIVYAISFVNLIGLVFLTFPMYLITQMKRFAERKSLFERQMEDYNVIRLGPFLLGILVNSFLMLYYLNAENSIKKGAKEWIMGALSVCSVCCVFDFSIRILEVWITWRKLELMGLKSGVKLSKILRYNAFMKFLGFVLRFIILCFCRFVVSDTYYITFEFIRLLFFPSGCDYDTHKIFFNEHELEGFRNTSWDLRWSFLVIFNNNQTLNILISFMCWQIFSHICFGIDYYGIYADHVFVSAFIFMRCLKLGSTINFSVKVIAYHKAPHLLPNDSWEYLLLKGMDPRRIQSEKLSNV